jgi:hypothetical protein
MFKKISPYIPFLIVFSTFLLITFIVQPFGNYPVNDDWDFYLHVKYFDENNYVKNSLIDAAFILQGFLGLFWVKFFGLSFLNLRILTIILAVILLLIINIFLNKLGIQQKVVYLVMFSILADPFFIFSSYSFMTEIYFLTFALASLYFFKKSQSIYPAIFLALLSCFIRQFGYILLFSYLIYFYKFDKKNKNLAITIAAISIAILGNYFFPSFTGNFDSKLDKLLSLFSSIIDSISKLFLLPRYIPYLVFTLSPLILATKNKPPVQLKRAYFLVLPLSFLLFYFDIFTLKNVFHLECYLCETDFRPTISILNNIPFKILLSIFLSFVIIKASLLIYSFIKNQEFKKITDTKIYVLNYFIMLSLGAIIISQSFYDRYFFCISILTVIVYSVYFQNKIEINKKSILAILLNLGIITLLNLDFHNSMKVRWDLGREISDKTGLKSEIYVTGTFSKFLYSIDKTPEELLTPIKMSNQSCYVLRYMTSTDNILNNFLESKIFNNKFIKNPTYPSASSPNNLPSVSDRASNTIKVTEYNSPIFNWLGKKTFYIVSCKPEILEKYKIPTFDFNSQK